MKRRALLLACAASPAVLWPGTAAAQSKKPAVIVASSSQNTGILVKAAPGIPIVQATGTSPMEAGRAASLARPGGMVTGLTNLAFAAERSRIIGLAQAQRWPLVAYGAAWAQQGALLSYGVEPLVLYRRAAFYVDRILKGAKPGDLPIEQPTKFELVVNLKTARTLGITIPQTVLLQADKVIE